jgi:hypothetical protein
VPFAGEAGVAGAGVVGVGVVTGGVGVGDGAGGGEVGTGGRGVGFRGGVGRTVGDGVSTMKGCDRAEMTTAVVGATCRVRAGFGATGLTVERTGGLGVGSTMLTGAETGWADGEASNAARQKYPVVTPATTRAEIRNASDVTRIRGSIWFRPDSIPPPPPLPADYRPISRLC